MDYDELIKRAIQNDELPELLTGEKGYEVEVSQFTSDVFPTNINGVLVNCFYKQIERYTNIEHLFIKTWMDLLRGPVAYVYIAVLYFDACIFQEEKGKATFRINKEIMAEKLQEAIIKNEKDLQENIFFQTV